MVSSELVAKAKARAGETGKILGGDTLYAGLNSPVRIVLGERSKAYRWIPWQRGG